GRYSAETRRKEFAENRGAATLGGPEPASAATPHPPLLASLQKPLIFIDSKSPLKPDRGWRQIAGPKLSPSELHCGTVTDGPNGQWEGGQYRRIEARNRH